MECLTLFCRRRGCTPLPASRGSIGRPRRLSRLLLRRRPRSRRICRTETPAEEPPRPTEGGPRTRPKERSPRGTSRRPLRSLECPAPARRRRTWPSGSGRSLRRSRGRRGAGGAAWSCSSDGICTPA